MTRFLVFLYDGLTLAISLLIYPLFYFHPRGRLRLHDRYGCWDVEGTYTWFHAASRGEVAGLEPILKQYHAEFPDSNLLLTVTSPTGLEGLPECVHEARLLPFESILYLRRALKNVTIEKFVVTETELWPNLFTELAKRKVPLFFVNAKISSKTMPFYSLTAPLWRWLLRPFERIAVANLTTFNRLSSLGVSEEKLVLTGDTKLDRSPSVVEGSAPLELKKKINPFNLSVLTLGSLRPGEEVWWFDILTEACRAKETFVCVIAPRHAERFEYFTAELKRREFQFVRWSDCVENGALGEVIYSPSQSVQIFLLDTFGTLEKCYALSNLVFIGATLVPKLGGHNPLEAMAYGVPTVVGPYVDKIHELVDEALQANALLQVSSEEELGKVAQRFLDSDATLKEIGASGKRYCQEQRGATERVMEVLRGKSVRSPSS